MDQFKKIRPADGQWGRLIRNMSVQHMMGSLQAGSWFAATDVYQTSTDIFVYMDVSGIDPEKLNVVAEEMSVTVSGTRQYPAPDKVSCIHQLEIERGVFERTVDLPRPVDVSKASSTCQNGFLIITLPLKQLKGKVKIEVA